MNCYVYGRCDIEVDVGYMVFKLIVFIEFGLCIICIGRIKICVGVW